ncbi:hypothetical protein QYE76_049578 [Lolium multiflorum]|uniref:Retrotransposon gag domain-containing protein n=1 Tax=Lolium multiflorum TaxID=4521 RepID=A0AAD8WGG5_LOLMU|nr:hypothetical protein QYE76_049578 [Lolium multiflorum]
MGPHHRAVRPMARQPPCGGGHLFRPQTLVPRPKLQRILTKVTALGRRTCRKELSAGRNPPGNSSEGEIDAIVTVIELDIISITIIIIIIIITAISTAAPRIAMNEVRKKLFSISLSGKAAHWYKLLDNGDSLEWNDIVPRFYSKFYPPSEIHKDRNCIYNFWPHDGESIAQAWGRLKSLMLKCPIHELPGNVIIDNFYARLSFQDKTLLDTSCSGSFTRNKEEFKRNHLDRIQENTEGWENDKDRESGIIYDYKCIEAFMDTDKFRNMSATYGLDSQVAANLYKAFASHYELPKKNFDKYHEPYKDKIDSSINKCVVVETADHVIPEAYIEKTPFPAKMKEYSVINSAVHKSEKKPIEPEEQIKVEPAVAIVKDLVTENVEDGHIIFCEDASNIVSHPNKPKQVSVPMLSVRIGDHCYYGLCDIGASVSAIPYELYTEIMHEIGSCELEDIDVVIQLANRETISPIGIVRDVEVLCGKIKYPADFLQHLENSESEAFRKERDELEEIFLLQPILKHDLPVEDLGTTPPPKEDPFRSTMVSKNRSKELSDEDNQDREWKEEDKSVKEEVKEDEEEVEEVPQERPRTTIASIGVVSNSFNAKKSARIRTGRGFPRHYLAPRTSSSGIHHSFRNLIYNNQIERTPKAALPSNWDIDRSNNAGRTEPEAEAHEIIVLRYMGEMNHIATDSPEPRWRTTPFHGSSSGDEDGGGDGSGVDGEAFRGHFPAPAGAGTETLSPRSWLCDGGGSELSRIVASSLRVFDAGALKEAARRVKGATTP